MKVAIVGCGYVGTATAQHLRVKSDYTITATTTTRERVAQLEGVAQRVAVLKGNDRDAMTAVLHEQGAGSPTVKNVANRLYKPARPHEKSPY